MRRTVLKGVEPQATAPYCFPASAGHRTCAVHGRSSLLVHASIPATFDEQSKRVSPPHQATCALTYGNGREAVRTYTWEHSWEHTRSAHRPKCSSPDHGVEQVLCAERAPLDLFARTEVLTPGPSVGRPQWIRSGTSRSVPPWLLAGVRGRFRPALAASWQPAARTCSPSCRPTSSTIVIRSCPSRPAVGVRISGGFRSDDVRVDRWVGGTVPPWVCSLRPAR